jgi:hypothetical protein
MPDAEVMTRSVDRLLLGLLVLLLVAAAAGALPGLYLAGSDLQASGEFLDGVGLVFGLGIVAIVAVPAATAGLTIRRLRRGRARARRWVIGTGLLGGCAVLPFGFLYQPLFAVLVLPVLLVLIALLDDGADSGRGPAVD